MGVKHSRLDLLHDTGEIINEVPNQNIFLFKECLVKKPVCLLFYDHERLCTVLASRLGSVLEELVHTDQTYCILGGLYSTTSLDVSRLFGLNMGLISLGQEKAFDRVQHNYNNYNNYILSKRQLEQK